jgi:transcriptional regulator with XRE-family HTH domain
MLTNLKAARASRGMKQVDLALALKISPSTLREIVCGRRQADTLLRTRIAEALRADEAWLFSTLARIPPLASGLEPSMPQAVRCARKTANALSGDDDGHKSHAARG